MQNQKSLTLFIIFFTIFSIISSCKKDNIDENVKFENIMSGQRMNLSEKELESWLLQKNLGLSSKSIPELVNRNLNFEKKTTKQKKNGDYASAIPLNDALNKEIGVDPNSISNLIVIEDSKGKIKWSAVVSFVPFKGGKNGLSQNSIFNLLDNEPINDDGTYTITSLKGHLLYKLGFKNSKLSSLGVVRTEAQISNFKGLKSSVRENLNMSINNSTTTNSNCVEYYLVTTTFYDDGTTTTETTFLGTICDDDGSTSGGGGGSQGDPDDEDPEIEVNVEGSSSSDGDDYTDDDFGVMDVSEGGGTTTIDDGPSPGSGTSLGYTFVYPYKVNAVIKTRLVTIRNCIMSDVTVFPASLSYTIPSKGRVLREITPLTVGKYQLAQPLGKVKLTWKYYVSRRYTFQISGNSNSMQSPLKSHDKIVSFY